MIPVDAEVDRVVRPLLVELSPVDNEVTPLCAVLTPDESEVIPVEVEVDKEVTPL